VSRRALVMTPEARLRDRVVDALRAAGLEVRAAGPGEDVATAFAAFRPDVVVASADPNGIAAWRAVRARHRNAAPDLVWVASRTGATETEAPSRFGPDAAEVLDPSDLERLVLRAGGSSPPPPLAPSAPPMAPSLALAEPEPPPLDLGLSVAELVTDEVEPEPPGAILLGPGLVPSPLHAGTTVGLSGPVEAATLEAAPAADASGSTRVPEPAAGEAPDHGHAPAPAPDADGPTQLGEAAAPAPTEASPPADALEAPPDPASDPTSDPASDAASDPPTGEAGSEAPSEADPAVVRVEAATLEAARAAMEESFQLYERRLAEVLAAERARSSAPPAPAPRGTARAPVPPPARPPLARGGPERGGSGLERPADPTGRPARARVAPAPAAPATATASPPARRRRPATRPPVRGAGRPATRPSTRPTTSSSDAPPPAATTPRTEDDEASSD
jgi:hypothetical protein